MAFRIWEARSFYEYYQISQQDDDDESENDGSDGKELKSRTEHSHSLFGIIWSIQKETGWSHNYIMWKESWFNIQMKLADATRLVDSSRSSEFKDDDELLKFLSE